MENKITAQEVIKRVKGSHETSVGYKYIAEYMLTDKDGDYTGYLTKYTDENQYVYSITYEDTEGILYETKTTQDIDTLLKALFWGDRPILEQ